MIINHEKMGHSDSTCPSQSPYGLQWTLPKINSVIEEDYLWYVSSVWVRVRVMLEFRVRGTLFILGLVKVWFWVQVRGLGLGLG